MPEAVSSPYLRPPAVMQRQRVTVFYSGRVQGVGFRFSVKQVATGFEVAGTVRNLADGRVELVAEGEQDELEAFLQAIPEAGLKPLIRDEEVHWTDSAGGLSGFAIVG